ncbi:MAG TPA: hypothetical protein VF018_06110 [Acidobacteriaceae bacterium]
MAIPPERWISNLLEVAASIADRKMQEEKWTAGTWNIWEHPDEMINTTDDYVLDGFIDAFHSLLSPAQESAARRFRDEVNNFCASSPTSLDPAKLLFDPAWERVRQSADEFIKAFAGKWPPSGAEDRARELVDEWMRAFAKRNTKTGN